MTEYTLERLAVNASTITTVATLLRSVFPNSTHFTDAGVTWQYVNNPVGHAQGFNAWHSAELAAHYATIPMLADVHGRVERGLLSLNTATHARHQGKGLFTQLANRTFEEAASNGFTFVVGVANANSTPGFIRKLGFQLVSPLRAMIGAGPLPRFDPSHSLELVPSWSMEALSWRLGRPGYDYRLVERHQESIVISPETRFGAHYILGRLPRELLLVGRHSQARSPAMKIWMGLDPTMNWRGSAFLNIPMRFRPSPLNLIFKDLTDAGRTISPNSARFQALDFDVI